MFDENVDVGIDPNQRELDRAEEIGKYDELLNCPGAEIPRPDGQFETIFSNSVLEHIEDLESVMLECEGVSTGLYMTVPTANFDKFSFVGQILALLRLRGLSTLSRGIQ